jgi:hypothetical protein
MLESPAYDELDAENLSLDDCIRERNESDTDEKRRKKVRDIAGRAPQGAGEYAAKCVLGAEKYQTQACEHEAQLNEAKAILWTPSRLDVLCGNQQ